MDITKDDEFLEISNLKWLPYIGDHFFKIPADKKILVVGESHYLNETTESAKKHNLSNYTRRVVNELAINRKYWGTKIFPNFHKALFRNDKFCASNLWNNVAYYNFVQRPMNTIQKRPNKKDFINGWYTFFKVVDILEPKLCIFIGTSAAATLPYSLKNSNYSSSKLIKCDLISNVYPRQISLIDSKKNEIKIHFIRHTSKMFSWKKWNIYLRKEISDELIWLDKKITSNTVGNNGS